MTPPAARALRLGARRTTTTLPSSTPRLCASIHLGSSTPRPLGPSQKITRLPNTPLRRTSTHSPIIPQSSSSRRSFHSTDHPPPPGPFGATESTLLAAAYKHVPEHGFTTSALALGARDAGGMDVSVGVLPGGEFALIRWHLHQQREALNSRAGEVIAAAEGGERGEGESVVGGRKLGIVEKVEILIWERLQGNREAIGHWQQALAVMAHPTHAPTSLKLLAELADDIVYLAGDKAVDPSWYTSRAGVATIYASAELFMTNDRSEGFRETREFVDRRMEEARALRGGLGDVGQWVSFQAVGAVNVARSLGVRI